MEALEKKLGISKESESSQSKKRRLDDDEYIEQSKEIVESVKSAVSAGILSWSHPSWSHLTNLASLCSLTQKEKESQS